jgi:dihydrofolate synthase/folylpolyglutamate synthase
MKKRNQALFEKCVKYLYSFINLERDTAAIKSSEYKLDCMRFLLKRFGNPQQGFKVIHIAGSKAKGSTACFLAAGLRAAGKHTGMYTSPHVSSILERIVINGEPVAVDVFTGLCGELQQVLGRIPKADFPGGKQPSFFELMTLLAWLAFKRQGCEYVILETGLGGRLDATNIVNPAAVVLTPIEMEHEAILGNTLEKIAAEKCGIIKRNIPVFCGFQNRVVKKVVREYAAAHNAALYFLDEAIKRLAVSDSVEHTEFSLSLAGDKERNFRLILPGAFQAENASLAFLVLHTLYPELPDDAFKEGFRTAFLPARMEVLNKNPLVIIDGAHTPGSVSRAVSSFSHLAGQRGVLLFAAVTGKKIEEMAAILAPQFLHIIISTPGSFRRSDPREVYKAFYRLNTQTTLEKNPARALKKALSLSGKAVPVLATGSLYFAAELRRLFSAALPS